VRNYALGIGIGAAVILAYVAAGWGADVSDLGFPILTVHRVPAAGRGRAGRADPVLQRGQASSRSALIASLAEVALVVFLVVDFPSGQAGFQFVSQHSWIGAVRHIVEGRRRRHLALPRRHDRSALPGRHVRAKIRGNRKAFMGWMLLLEAACMGTFLSMDLFLFFVMFEVTLVPGYFLVAGWGGPGATTRR
jgi:NADH-quinone oxidoreductase subunit M